MIIDNALIAALALGSDKNIPQDGDSQVVVLPILQPVERLLQPHHIAPGAASQVIRNSIFSDFTRHVAASAGATAQSVVVLPPGLWTVNWSLSSRFTATSAAGTDPHVHFLVSMEADTIDICSHFMQTGQQVNEGSFRLLNQSQLSLRLDTDATGVGQTIDAILNLQIERNI